MTITPYAYLVFYESTADDIIIHALRRSRNRQSIRGPTRRVHAKSGDRHACKFKRRLIIREQSGSKLESS
jgi:hypothetical protein